MAKVPVRTKRPCIRSDFIDDQRNLIKGAIQHLIRPLYKVLMDLVFDYLFEDDNLTTGRIVRSIKCFGGFPITWIPFLDNSRTFTWISILRGKGETISEFSHRTVTDSRLWKQLPHVKDRQYWKTTAFELIDANNTRLCLLRNNVYQVHPTVHTRTGSSAILTFEPKLSAEIHAVSPITVHFPHRHTEVTLIGLAYSKAGCLFALWMSRRMLFICRVNHF